ncbi:MAG: DUF3261 domain-containing protein [Aliiglaciecola sp.]|uniref:DUF3261 domain-containing protein n=1 Tax=Aliiglaciecola sp. TaxID=1872441 RepID=UPI003297CAF8
MSKRLTIVICLCLCLGACSLLNSGANRAFPLLLLPPVNGPESAIYKQRLELESETNFSKLLVVLKIDKSEIKLRGLLPTGQSVYALDYDGQNLNHQSFGGNELPAQDILSMLQFALWPESAIRQYYQQDEGWLLEIKPKYRLLSLNGSIKLRVDYLADQQLMLENYAHQYKVKIETLEYKRL